MVTDGEARAALAACRGLRSAGYEIDAVASRAPAAVHWSRFCSRRLWAPDPRADRAGFADALHSYLTERRYDVLLPATDAALLVVSEDRDRLSGLAAVGLPSHEAVLRCLSKASVVEGSEATTLAAPWTVPCRTADEAHSAARWNGFPVLVKPQMSARPDGAGLRQRSSRSVGDESELSAVIEDFGLPVLVQRRLQGPVYSLGGVVTKDGLVAAAYSRYVRTWPPDAGNVSCSVSLPMPPGLRESAATLLDRLRWRGIFELEMMERSDGGFGVIDLNPRPYGSLELAVRAGASLPTIWCDSLLGTKLVSETRDARAGVWYRWENADARHALRQLRSGRIREISAVLRPRRGTAHALFRAADPWPLLAEVIFAIKGRRRGEDRKPGAEESTPVAGSAA